MNLEQWHTDHDLVVLALGDNHRDLAVEYADLNQSEREIFDDGFVVGWCLR